MEPTMATVIAWAVCIPFAAVSLYLCLELASGLKSLRSKNGRGTCNLPIVILVPAHNEAGGITDTVRSLLDSSPGSRIVVVADNCSDETAFLAEEAGAEVIERHKPSQRGKGFALAFGRDFLRASPPSIVIVVDADCRLQKGSAEILADVVVRSGGPAQSANLLCPSAQVRPLEALSNFAMLIKNLVRARGLMRIGGGISLFGTGMAFPWELFARLELATAAVVEDLELGLLLAREGIRIELVEDALVSSPSAIASDTRDQRRRWEHGFLHQAFISAIPLLFAGIRTRSRHLLSLGAHMLVPPLALHMLIGLGVIVGTALLGYAGGSYMAFATGNLSMFGILLLLFIAWWKEGRQSLSFRNLALAPIYVLWKIPIYFGLLTKRQTGWNRSRRANERV